MPDHAALVDAVRALAVLSRVVNPVAADLSPADYRVMSVIASGEDRASRLAARLALGRPTISATVDSLSGRGLISRSSVPGDQRATALSLSPDGVEVLARIEGRMARQLELLCERTPDGERVIESLSWLGAVVEAAIDDRIDREQRTPEPPSDEPPAGGPASEHPA